jgi:hypothetical protein
MKGKFIQNYLILLASDSFEEFANKLSKYFSVYSAKLLPLGYSYLDWLIIKLRPVRKQKIPQGGLNSDYIKSKISVNAKTSVYFGDVY